MGQVVRWHRLSVWGHGCILEVPCGLTRAHRNMVQDKKKAWGLQGYVKSVAPVRDGIDWEGCLRVFLSKQEVQATHTGDWCESERVFKDAQDVPHGLGKTQGGLQIG